MQDTERLEKSIKESKCNLFGRRYERASLSHISQLGEGNQRSISQWLKDPKRFIIFLGAPGVGKTHFCSAIYESACYKSGNIFCVRVLSEKDFLMKIRETIEMKGDYHRAVNDICETPYLIYDDLGSSGLNDWRREVVLAMIDERYASGYPTIITSNLTRSELYNEDKGVGKRSASRLLARENLIIEMHDGEDFRQREE